jgi:hypothetical protein
MDRAFGETPPYEHDRFIDSGELALQSVMRVSEMNFEYV